MEYTSTENFMFPAPNLSASPNLILVWLLCPRMTMSLVSILTMEVGVMILIRCIGYTLITERMLYLMLRMLIHKNLISNIQSLGNTNFGGEVTPIRRHVPNRKCYERCVEVFDGSIVATGNSSFDHMVVSINNRR